MAASRAAPAAAAPVIAAHGSVRQARARVRTAPTVSTAPYHNGFVNVALGSVTLSYSTPAYTSGDQQRSFALFYASGQASPTGFVQVDATNSAVDPASKLSIRLRNVASGGYETLTNGTQELVYTAGIGTSRLAAQFSAGHLSSGAHPYDVIVTAYWPDGTSLQAPAVRVRVLVVNERSSPYGVGWSSPGVQRMYHQGDGIFIVEGDGTGRWFPRSPQCTTPTQQWCHYESPDGDFSRLTYDAQHGVYLRHYHPNTVVEFSTAGRMNSVSGGNGVAGVETQFTYDGSGRLSSIVDPSGRSIALAYNGAGKLATITDPAARVVTATVGAGGTLDQVCDPLGCPVQAGYDAGQRMTWRTDRANSTWNYEYDTFGRLRLTTAPAIVVDGGASVRPTQQMRSLSAAMLPPAGTGTLATPGPRVLPGKARVKVTDARGDSTRVVLDRFGQPLRLDEPLGRVTTFERDVHGRPTRTVAPNGDVTTYTYTGPYPKTVHDVTNDRLTTYTYSSYWGYPHASYPIGSYETFPVTVSAPGEPVVEKMRHGAYSYISRSGASRWYVDGIDDYDRPTMVYGPGGHTQYFYDTAGLDNLDSVRVVTGLDTLTTRLFYDAAGRVVRQVQPDGREARFAYDALNRVVRTSSAVDSIRYTFSPGGHVQTVTDGKGQTTTLGWNALGLLVSEQDPRGLTTRSAYDVAGNLVAVTNRRGQTVRFLYDAVGRVTRRTSHEGEVTTYAYDPGGLWTATQNPASTDTVRVVRGAQPYREQVMVRGGHRYVVTTQGDTVARTLTTTGSWGYGVEYRFEADHSGRLEQLRDVQLAQNTTITHDTTDNSTSTLLPTGASIVRRPYQQVYDAPGSGGALDVPLFTTDPQRRFTQFNYVDQKYDVGGRLREQGGIVDWSFQYKVLEAFDWDSAGNPRHRSASVSGGNRLDAFAGYTLEYDEDGNLVHVSREIGPGGETREQYLTWNSLGQLTEVITSTPWTSRTVRYTYDGHGRRVSREVSHPDPATGMPAVSAFARYVHDASDVVAEVDAAGAVTRSYTYYPGIDLPHSLRVGNQTYYYVTDPRGNVTGLVHPTQGVVNRYSYSAFGADSIVVEGVANPLRFAGRELDPETGLYYLRARYYAPELQRFVSEDPLGTAGGTNPYAYAGNDPMNASDPSGLCPVGIGWMWDGKQWVPWNPCPDEPEAQQEFTRFWTQWYFSNHNRGHDPADEAAYMAELDAQREREAWAAARAEGINGAVYSSPYQGLSDAEKIVFGVKARLAPVQPYLEAAAVGAIAFPAIGTVGGAAAFFGGGSGMTVMTIRWGRLAPDIVQTFRSGAYTARYLDAPQTLYRVFGGNAREAGRFWTTVKPNGPLQAQLDMAVHPTWGNTLTHVATARVPAGTMVFEGIAGPQGLMVGGGPQVFIPQVNPAWITSIIAF